MDYGGKQRGGRGGRQGRGGGGYGPGGGAHRYNPYGNYGYSGGRGAGPTPGLYLQGGSSGVHFTPSILSSSSLFDRVSNAQVFDFKIC